MKASIKISLLLVLLWFAAGCTTNGVIAIGMPYTRVVVVNQTQEQVTVIGRSRYSTETMVVASGGQAEFSPRFTPFGDRGDNYSIVVSGNGNGVNYVGETSCWVNKYTAVRVHRVYYGYGNNYNIGY